MRLCLSLGVVPVFAPPRETGFQAAIENYNGRWQAKVWARFTHDVAGRPVPASGRFVAASRLRAAARIEAAPPRRPFPEGWGLDLQAQPQRPDHLPAAHRAQGAVELLGHRFEVDATWPHRLVRAEVDLDANGSGSTPCDGASRAINRCSARPPIGCLAGSFKSDRELLSLAIDSRSN